VRKIRRRNKVKYPGDILEFIYFLTKEQKCKYIINMGCHKKNLWGAGRSSL